MVGVNTALLSNNTKLGSIGLGFALPSNDAAFVAHEASHPETATVSSRALIWIAEAGRILHRVCR